MIFVKSPISFYALRFLLGVAEAGFIPGGLLYLTYWYPAKRRGRITALFLTAIPMSSISVDHSRAGSSRSSAVRAGSPAGSGSS